MYLYDDENIHICHNLIIMRNKRQLILQQLEQKIALFAKASDSNIPSRGWIHAVRSALNMTREQLSVRLNMSIGAVQKLEEREANEQISLKKLKMAAQALDMKLVYGFVPNDGSLEQLIERKAQKLARTIVLRTNQNMQLEEQGIPYERIEQAISELSDELQREVKRSLWD